MAETRPSEPSDSTDSVTVEFTQAVFRYEDRTVVVARQRPDRAWDLIPSDLGLPFGDRLADSWSDAQHMGCAMVADIVKYRRTVDEATAELRAKWPLGKGSLEAGE